MDTTARPLTADAAPRPGPLEPPAPAAAGELAAVTITGCLETDGRRYRLADTSGAEAPKSRSWRSGFLKKRSAAVELAESGGGLALAGHVGRRVAATGVLVDRRMEVRSLRRLAASCD